MSADQAAMDMAVPYAAQRVMTGTIGLLGVLALMSQVAWQILVLVLPIAVACILYQVCTSTSFYLVLEMTNGNSTQGSNRGGINVENFFKKFEASTAFTASNIFLVSSLMVKPMSNYACICGVGLMENSHSNWLRPKYLVGMQRYYIASGRQLSRINSAQRSPIINHYEESITGAATIRGFRQEKRFMDMNLSRLDSYANSFFHKGAAGEWLSLRMEMLSVVAYTVFLMVMVALPRGSLSPSKLDHTLTFYFNRDAKVSWELNERRYPKCASK